MRDRRTDIRVLLVEDEEWVRESVRFVLSSQGSGLVVAASARDGAEALRHIDEDSAIDVALVDLGLPDMRGAELIRRMRDKRPGLPTVVFTVFEDPLTSSKPFAPARWATF